MYSTLPNFVFGFHGCDQKVYEKVIKQGEHLVASENQYDWLGHGIYFWENNPQRAWEYAEELKHRDDKLRKRDRVENVAVVGAVIDLGYCLNIMESKSLMVVRAAYDTLKHLFDTTGKKLPENINAGSNSDLLLRSLDCAVIEMVHTMNEEENGRSIDSVRGLFIEGKELYLNAGFKEMNHIQICVRNPNCIKGYFSPLVASNKFPIP